MAEDGLRRGEGEGPFVTVWLDNVKQFQAFADAAGCGDLTAVRALSTAGVKLQTALADGARTAAVASADEAVADLEQAIPPAP